MSRLTVAASARTHVGLVRRRNEDAVCAGQNLFAVADGLGGHAAGDFASSTVIDALKPYDLVHSPPDLPDVLGQAIHAANLALRDRVEIDPDVTTMGTTLVAMLWSGTTLVVGNIGDSRVLCSDGLSGVVPIEVMRAVLGSATDPGDAAEQLVELALEGGGPDNITVLVIDVRNADVTMHAPR